MNNPAIVVVAYNRPASLKRLLSSIAKGSYPDSPITLHISIDKSDVPEVVQYAQEFEWIFGPKIVEVSAENLGLKKHILQCGALTEKYDSIIVLEDDLVLAPHFYQFANEGLQFYESDERIAGISLYNYQIAESCGYPFQAIHDESDVYFMQVASSWGQAWTKQQWSLFSTWHKETEESKLNLLPEYILQWGEHSWKKYFINYLLDKNRYFVFPQTSFSTNFEDFGTNATTSDLYQVELETSKRQMVLKDFSDSQAIYDVYFELEGSALNKHTSMLAEYDVEVDLFGQKPITKAANSYFLSTRKGANPVFTFSSKMRPLINNTIFNVEGNEIGLYRKEDLDSASTDLGRFFSTSLLQKVNSEMQGVISLSIVIPIVEYNEEDLLKTLNSIPFGVGLNECIISCHKDSFDSVKSSVASLGINVQILSSNTPDESQLLKSGLDSARQEIVTWCRPGSVFAADVFDQLPKIFNAFAEVNWIRGMEEQFTPESYSVLNAAPYRWNSHMLEKYSGINYPHTTELMFWRKSVYNNNEFPEFSLSSKRNVFMQKVNLYVVAYNFGTRKVKKGDQTLHSDFSKSLKKHSFARKLLGSLSYIFFRRNSSPLRLIFVETLELPYVLRYDNEDKRFYSSKY
ncbi:MAG: hypothetical protein QNK23_16100 [Crocinitomicaceae bacterium]|nr:hypothetical protein [Crocinitomicaceae bacterium]